MTTMTLEAPRATVTKSAKVVAKAKANNRTIVHAAKAAEKASKAKLPKQATVADKVRAAKVTAPKAKAEPKPRRVSAMWVIRSNMAESLATSGKPATVEMISKACTEAGVPKSDATIGTIISDFNQTYLAMQAAGLIKA